MIKIQCHIFFSVIITITCIKVNEKSIHMKFFGLNVLCVDCFCFVVVDT